MTELIVEIRYFFILQQFPIHRLTGRQVTGCLCASPMSRPIGARQAGRRWTIRSRAVISEAGLVGTALLERPASWNPQPAWAGTASQPTSAAALRAATHFLHRMTEHSSTGGHRAPGARGPAPNGFEFTAHVRRRDENENQPGYQDPFNRHGRRGQHHGRNTGRPRPRRSWTGRRSARPPGGL